MFNSQSRQDEEFRSLYNEDEHIRIEPKVPPRPHQPSPTDRASLFFALLFVVVMGVAFLRAGQTPAKTITREDPAPAAAAVVEEEERKPTTGREENERTPKILWVLTGVELGGVRML
jgi:hypothetical protein